MRNRLAPRLPLALLGWCVPGSAALAGDLIEEFRSRQSVPWLYWQVLGAIWIEFSTRPEIIRPLTLVDLQPADAIERSRRMSLRFRPVNMTATPVYGAGGLGLVMLSMLMTLVVPAVWLVLAASMLAGVGLGVIMIVVHRDHPTALRAE